MGASNPDPALARHVADWMTSAALAPKGDFRGVSLSGGSTPKALFTLLASDPFIGRFLESGLWFWGDGASFLRSSSNYRMTRGRCWPRRLFHWRTFIPCRPTAPLEAAALRRTLQAAWRRGTRSGAANVRHHSARQGPDGHTASLLPGEPVKSVSAGLLPCPTGRVRIP